GKTRESLVTVTKPARCYYWCRRYYHYSFIGHFGQIRNKSTRNPCGYWLCQYGFGSLSKPVVKYDSATNDRDRSNFDKQIGRNHAKKESKPNRMGRHYTTHVYSASTLYYWIIA